MTRREQLNRCRKVRELHVTEMQRNECYRVSCAGTCGRTDCHDHVVNLHSHKFTCDCPGGSRGHFCKHVAAVVRFWFAENMGLRAVVVKSKLDAERQRRPARQVSMLSGAAQWVVTRRVPSMIPFD